MRIIIQVRGIANGVTTIDRTINARGGYRQLSPEEIRAAIQVAADETKNALAPESDKAVQP